MPYISQDSKHSTINVAINDLGLSEETLQTVQRSGVTTIGDCIDFFNARKNKGVMETFQPGLLKAMITEVKQKLVEKDYWRFVDLDE